MTLFLYFKLPHPPSSSLHPYNPCPSSSPASGKRQTLRAAFSKFLTPSKQFRNTKLSSQVISMYNNLLLRKGKGPGVHYLPRCQTFPCPIMTQVGPSLSPLSLLCDSSLTREPKQIARRQHGHDRTGIFFNFLLLTAPSKEPLRFSRHKHSLTCSKETHGIICRKRGPEGIEYSALFIPNMKVTL